MHRDIHDGAGRLGVCGRDGTALPVAVSALASTPGAPVGSSTGRRRLSEPPLGPPTGAVAVAGASGLVAVESATGFGRVESSVVDSAATSPVAGVWLLDLLDESAPPVASTIPGGTCRTDASSTPRCPTQRRPPYQTPARGAVRLRTPDGRRARGSSRGSGGVEVPWDSEVPLVPVAPAVPVDPPEPADPVSSAHATPGVVATAMPTPNATANPPTRPMYFALPIHGLLPRSRRLERQHRLETFVLVIEPLAVCMARRCLRSF